MVFFGTNEQGKPFIVQSLEGGGWGGRPNEDVASTANTNITDRIVGTLSREFNFFKDIKYSRSSVALVYQGRTGHNYSWVFKGDANGDGASGNDLIYGEVGEDRLFGGSGKDSLWGGLGNDRHGFV